MPIAADGKLVTKGGSVLLHSVARFGKRMQVP
jgi:hypothetical protein